MTGMDESDSSPLLGCDSFDAGTEEDDLGIWSVVMSGNDWTIQKDGLMGKSVRNGYFWVGVCRGHRDELSVCRR